MDQEFDQKFGAQEKAKGEYEAGNQPSDFGLTSPDKSNSPGKEYYPAGVLAKEFDYAVDYISWLARTGKVEAVRKGKRWIVTRESVKAHKESAQYNKQQGGWKSLRFSSSEARLENRESSIFQPSSKFGKDRDKNSSFSVPSLVSVRRVLIEKADKVRAVSMVILGSGLLLFSLVNFQILKIDFNKKPIVESYQNLQASIFESVADFLNKPVFNTLADKTFQLTERFKDNLDQALTPFTRTIIVRQEVPVSQNIYQGPVTIVQPEKIKEKTIQIKTIEKVITQSADLTAVYAKLERLDITLSDNIQSISQLSSRFNTVPTIFSPPPSSTNAGITILNPKNLESEKVTISSLLTVTGSSDLTGDLTVDSGVLKVDTANNRIGINTSSPATALDIVGAASVSSNLTIGGSLTLTGSSTFSSPLLVNARAEIQGTASASYLLTGNTLQVGGFSSTSYSRFGISTISGPSSNWITQSNDILVSGDLYGVGSLSFQGPASLSNTLWVSPGGYSGNVGIGTTGPGAGLVIQKDAVSTSRGSVQIINTAATASALEIQGDGVDASLWFHDPGTDSWSIGRDVGTGNFEVTTRTNLGSQERLVVNTAGNVGIGTTSPDSLLELSSTATNFIIRSTGSTSSASIDFQPAGGASSSNQGKFTIRAGGLGGSAERLDFINATDTKLMTIASSGNVGIGTTSPVSTLTVNNQTGPALTINSGDNRNAITFQTAGSSKWIQYLIGTDMRFFDATNSQDRVTFQTGGNVGIGTTGPATLLHIKGTTPTLRIEGARKYDLRLDADVSGQFDIADMTTGVARLVINPNGNVGIGTTGPVQMLNLFVSGGVPLDTATLRLDTYRNANGANALEAFYSRGTSGSPLAVSSGDNIFQLSGFGMDANAGSFRNAGRIEIAVDGTPGASDMPGRIAFWTTPDGSATLAERVRIDNAGNVGIGTTVISSPLTIVKIASVDTTGATGKWTIRTKDDTTAAAGVGGSVLFQGNKSAAGGIGNFAGIAGLKENATDNNEQGYLALYTVPASSVITERVRIDSSGNVGIGTTGPVEKLQVAGAIAATGTAVTAFANSATMDFVSGGMRLITRGADTVTKGIFQIAQETSNASSTQVPLYINTSGNIGIGTTSPITIFSVRGGIASISFNSQDGTVLQLMDNNGTCTHNPNSASEAVSCSSDARLKTNIRPAASELSYLTGIPLRNFELIADGRTYTGTVAQELLTLPDYANLVSSNSDGFYLVAEPNPWKIVKAIQELDLKIASLSEEFKIRGSTSGQIEVEPQESGTYNISAIASGLITWFKDALHIVFEEGLIKVAKGIFDTVEAKFVKTERIEASVGVTVFDRTTGQPYCMGVDNGVTVSTPGACGENTNQTSEPTPTPEATPVPSEPVVTETPMAETASSSEEVLEPMPTPEPSTAPSPEVTPEPTPEAEISPSPTPESSPEITPAP